MRLLLALSVLLGACGAVRSHWMHDVAAVVLAAAIVAQLHYIRLFSARRG